MDSDKKGSSPKIEVIDINVPNPHEPPSPVEWDSKPTIPYDGRLCPCCFGFNEVFRQLQRHDKLLPAIRAGSRFFHRKNIAELRDFAGRGCPLCKVFLQALEMGEHGTLWFQEYHSPIPEEGAINIHQEFMRRLEDPTRFDISVGKHMSSIQPSLQFVPVNKSVQEAIRMSDAVASLDDDDMSYSAAAMTTHWLRDCIDNHPLCNAYIQQNAPPTRLLDLRKECVALCTNPPPNAVYAALSHRWSDPAPLKLTKESLTKMTTAIEASSIPTTFQHAIKVCRTTGVDFLWIDSLCIIQDSLEDWRAESVKMSEVYRNAVFTISATQANADKGLRLDRKYFPGRPVNMQVEVPDGFFNHAAGTLHCRIKQETDGDNNVYLERFFTKGPLFSRSWVLQEQVLSCRLLSFTKGELQWECLESERTESVPEGLAHTSIPSWANDAPQSDDEDRRSEELRSEGNDGDSDSDNASTKDVTPSKPGSPRLTSLQSQNRSDRDASGGTEEGEKSDEDDETGFPKLVPFAQFKRKVNRMAMMRRRRTDYMQVLKRGIAKPATLASLPAEQEFHFSWYILVENYSRRQITYDYDRLVALAGVSKLVGQARDDAFIAGLWKKYLWRDLLWTTTTYSHWEMKEGEPCRRSSTFQCPSWTWASISGYIKYTHNEFDSFADHELLAEHVEATLDSSATQFQDHTVSGSLKLRTMFKKAVADERDLVDKESGKRIGRFDADIKLSAKQEVWCLAISKYNHVHGGMSIENPSTWCIAVVSVDNTSPQVYTRVGLAKWDKKAWQKLGQLPVADFEVR